MPGAALEEQAGARSGGRWPGTARDETMHGRPERERKEGLQGNRHHAYRGLHRVTASGSASRIGRHPYPGRLIEIKRTWQKLFHGAIWTAVAGSFAGRARSAEMEDPGMSALFVATKDLETAPLADGAVLYHD